MATSIMNAMLPFAVWTVEATLGSEVRAVPRACERYLEDPRRDLGGDRAALLLQRSAILGLDEIGGDRPAVREGRAEQHAAPARGLAPSQGDAALADQAIERGRHPHEAQPGDDDARALNHAASGA